jgi:ribosomal protein S6
MSIIIKKYKEKKNNTGHYFVMPLSLPNKLNETFEDKSKSIG